MRTRSGLVVAGLVLAIVSLVVGAEGGFLDNRAAASSSVLVDTYYLTLSPAAFTPTYDATAFQIYTSGASGGSGPGAIYAPVELPHGATMTNVRFVLRDATDSADVRIRLDRYPVTSSTVTYIAIWRSEGTNSDYQQYNGALHETVDNQAYYYYVVAFPSNGDWAASNTAVKAVTIAYTLPSSMRAYMPLVQRADN